MHVCGALYVERERISGTIIKTTRLIKRLIIIMIIITTFQNFTVYNKHSYNSIHIIIILKQSKRS